MEDNEIEIKEPGEYGYNKEEVYSHSLLVMGTLKKCRENRSKEMRDGYFNIKFDRMGNAHRVWMPDSRQEFIESVESLLMIQERDYDEEAEKEIEKIKKEVAFRYSAYCKREEEEWNKMPHDFKQQLIKKGSYFRQGYLSEDLPYIKEFIRDKVILYTKIVSEIQKLIKRSGDYREEIYEA